MSFNKFTIVMMFNYLRYYQYGRLEESEKAENLLCIRKNSQII